MTETLSETPQVPVAPEPCRLVVCLGNPGSRYAGTRHNVGWGVADRLLADGRGVSCACAFREAELYALPGGLHLLKPLTYMNASGLAADAVIRQLGLSPRELLVICDCLDLPVGRLRLRRRGSSGGQKGVESVIAALQSEDFPRLRIGIGRPEPGDEVIDYVLSPWASAEQETMSAALSAAAVTVGKIVSDGWDSALMWCNSWAADAVHANVKGETEIGKV